MKTKWATHCAQHASLIKRQARLALLLESKGGCCEKCSSTKKLEFDHIDPSTKLFDVSAGLLRKMSSLWAEVEKCQLLCRECHIEKSASELKITRKLFMQKRGTRAYDFDIESFIGSMELDTVNIK